MRVMPNLYPAFDGDEPFAVHHLARCTSRPRPAARHEVFVLHPRPQRRHPRHQRRRRRRDDAACCKRRFLEHAATRQRALHAGDHQPRPRGRRIDRPPPRPAARAAVRARRDPRRAAGVQPLRGRLHPVRHHRGRARSRASGSLFANDDVVCVCPYWSGTPYEMLIIPRNHDLHLTDASDATLAAVGHRHPRRDRACCATRIGDVVVQHRCSTPRRTTTTARSTGTCTCGRSWSRRPGSSGAPA